MDIFGRVHQKADIWVNEVAEELGWEDRAKSFQALRAGLHALRDRLGVDEAVQLGAQLPMLIRGLYYEGWTPHDKPVKVRTRDEFLQMVRRPFRQADPMIDPEAIARAVFEVLSRHITPGELADVQHSLPKSIHELWTSPRRLH